MNGCVLGVDGLSRCTAEKPTVKKFKNRHSTKSQPISKDTKDKQNLNTGVSVLEVAFFAFHRIAMAAKCWDIYSLTITYDNAITGASVHHSRKIHIILSALMLTTLASGSCLAQQLVRIQTQTVTIQAKRLSPQVKTTYDQQQINLQIQQVIVAAKHLSAAEKLAYDKTHGEK